MLQTAGLNVNQHLNNVKLPIDEHHVLSIAQYSADTFCEVALFDERTGKRVHLQRLYKHSDAVAYTTDYFHYVGTEDLGEIINSAQKYVRTLNA
tara:strand:- start:127 stop:408 length:282 start_codon:yes stop_codon:yes gene_type:complete